MPVGGRKMSEIKTCPFCGTVPIITVRKTVYPENSAVPFKAIAQCPQCIAEKYVFGHDLETVESMIEKVIERWNHREVCK
jgi:hypothetical protein